MYKLWFLAAVAVLAVANAEPGRPGRAALGGRMHGGQPTTIQSHPHIVSILSGMLFQCAGSILSPSYVLTSAYCLKEKSPNSFTVRAGSNRWKDGGSVHNLKKIILHEKFAVHGNYSVNDIALAEVSPPFELDRSRKVIETFGANERVWSGTAAKVAGWGNNGTISGFQDELHAVDTWIASKHDCILSYQTNYTDLTEELICSDKIGQRVCDSDYGGPLVVGGRVVGIASHLNNCHSSHLGLFVKVNQYHDWIAQYLYG